MDNIIRSLLYPIGFLASLLFFSRSIIQWIASEKEKRSYTPDIFWKLSLGGNCLLCLHNIIQLHFPLSLLQALHAVISYRSIALTKKTPGGLLSVFALFFAAAVLVSGLFVWQGLFLLDQITWISPPHTLGLEQVETVSPFIHVVGMIGVTLFSLRFWVVWWHAEKTKHPVLHASFFTISIIGALLSVAYFFTLNDPVNGLGPLLSIIPFARNLVLLKREQKAQKKPFSSKIFIFAGEASGDAIAANVIEKLKEANPALSFFGVGGVKSKQMGVEMLYTLHEFQFIGFSAILRNLFTIIRRFLSLKQKILSENPQACIFIDCPDISMRLAKALRKAGYTGKIIQIVAPSVWAWRSGRKHQMAKHFNLLLTLFSFEPDHFQDTSLKTIWMGHPMVEFIPNRDHVKEQLLAIFPGSRPEEVRRNLEKQLQAAAFFYELFPSFSLGISIASKSYADAVVATIDHIKQEHNLTLPEVTLYDFASRYELMSKATLALAKSGTVTLELALHDVPTVVTYNVSFLNRFVAKYVFDIRTPYFSLVNILRKGEVFPELIREEPSSKRIAQALVCIASDTSMQDRIREECKLLRDMLANEKEPSKVAVEEIEKILI